MRGNSNYGLVTPGSLLDKVAYYQRRKLFAAFKKITAFDASHTILDVGVSSDNKNYGSNYLEALYPYKGSITAAAIDDASFLQRLYPGLRFLQANGFSLPFANDSFDIVHASAVIEHVGGRERQIRFLRELWRVARDRVFVTTPNRWFPVEFHTVLPLLHWLPPPIYRKALVYLARDFFAKEENLNLLSRRGFASAARGAGLRRYQIHTVRLLGFASNLFLTAHKRLESQ